MTAYSTIQVTREGAAGIITFDRPKKLNAVSTQMMTEIAAALGELGSDVDVRAVVLTGSQRAFSTGADLDEAVTAVSTLEAFDYNHSWRRLTYAIEHLPKPVVAAISGHCITGGLEIAMCCDIRIATEDATFALTSSKIGSLAAAGGTQRLPRIVGTAVAKDLLFTSRFFGADEAFRIGLVNRVVPNGEVMKHALEYVADCAKNAPLSLALGKTAINTGVGLDLESGLDLEASLSAQAFATADKVEGMRAFLEKRSPNFTGR